MRPKYFLSFSILLFVASTLLAGPFDYVWRGDRKEGLKPKNISGYDIELISVLAYREKAPSVPDRLKVAFYLPGTARPHITVRELNFEKAYWLDEVKRETPWSKGVNEYSWPTDAVIRPGKINVSRLGVLVRLDRNNVSNNETVAPALFYHSNKPQGVSEYRFTFRAADNATILYYKIYQGKEAVYTGGRNLAVTSRAFTLRWKPGAAPAGQYRLVLRGVLDADNQRLQQTVRFHHRPNLR